MSESMVMTSQWHSGGCAACPLCRPNPSGSRNPNKLVESQLPWQPLQKEACKHLALLMSLSPARRTGMIQRMIAGAAPSAPCRGWWLQVFHNAQDQLQMWQYLWWLDDAGGLLHPTSLLVQKGPSFTLWPLLMALWLAGVNSSSMSDILSASQGHQCRDWLWTRKKNIQNRGCIASYNSKGIFFSALQDYFVHALLPLF
jgi:hypothetical protein